MYGCRPDGDKDNLPVVREHPTAVTDTVLADMPQAMCECLRYDNIELESLCVNKGCLLAVTLAQIGDRRNSVALVYSLCVR